MLKASKDWTLWGVGSATCLGLVMTFSLKEDDPHLYRSFDTERLSLGLGVWRGRPKYTEIFDPAMCTGYRVSKWITRQTIHRLILFSNHWSEVENFFTCRHASIWATAATLISLSPRTSRKWAKHEPEWVGHLFHFWTYCNCFKHFLIKLGCWNFGCRFGPPFCMRLFYFF